MRLPSFRFCAAAVLSLVSLMARGDSLPADLAKILADFRAEGTKGWRFVQTTRSGDESLVEQFDPSRPDYKRWTLRQKDGRAPTDDEMQTYNQTQVRRSSNTNAPRIQDQLDLTTATLLPSAPERPLWRFRLKSGGGDDTTAAFMSATLTFNLPTRSVERVELANTEVFSPALWIKIFETKTVMNYTVPSAEKPALLHEVTLHIRGRAFWVKSLNQDMTITFSEQEWAGKKLP